MTMTASLESNDVRNNEREEGDKHEKNQGYLSTETRDHANTGQGQGQETGHMEANVWHMNPVTHHSNRFPGCPVLTWILKDP